MESVRALLRLQMYLSRHDVAVPEYVFLTNGLAMGSHSGAGICEILYFLALNTG